MYEVGFFCFFFGGSYVSNMRTEGCSCSQVHSKDKELLAENLVVLAFKLWYSTVCSQLLDYCLSL